MGAERSTQQHDDFSRSWWHHFVVKISAVLSAHSIPSGWLYYHRSQTTGQRTVVHDSSSCQQSNRAVYDTIRFWLTPHTGNRLRRDSVCASRLMWSETVCPLQGRHVAMCSHASRRRPGPLWVRRRRSSGQPWFPRSLLRATRSNCSHSDGERTAGWPCVTPTHHRLFALIQCSLVRPPRSITDSRYPTPPAHS